MAAPALFQDVRIESNHVGVRPSRDVVRLEIEYRTIASPRKKVRTRFALLTHIGINGSEKNGDYFYQLK